MQKKLATPFLGKNCLNHFLKTIPKNSGDDCLKLCLLIYSAGIKSNNEAFAGQFQGISETSYDDLFKSIVSHANETYNGSIDIIYNADFLVESEKIERQNGYSSLKIFTGDIELELPSEQLTLF